MANPATQYEIIGIVGGGTISKKVRGVPHESLMIAWAKARHAKFVIRYYPSRKGWRILDIREATVFDVQMKGRIVPVVKGFQRGSVYWPTRDAAIMRALAMSAG